MSDRTKIFLYIGRISFNKKPRIKMFIIKNKITRFISLLAIANALLLSYSVNLRAQETTKQNDNSDYGLPTHRRDGGSRSSNSSCVDNAGGSNLVALIPEKTVGINASASPKLFFYIPKVERQKTLEFILRDEQDNLIYEAFLTTKGSGIISINIPEDIGGSLVEENTNYHWYLSTICNPQQRSRDIVVEGWMRQSTVDVANEQKLERIDSVAQAELYRDRGYWYDALSVLANDLQSEAEQPNVRAKWSELLESVGLKELATAPFVDSQLIESSTVEQ